MTLSPSGQPAPARDDGTDQLPTDSALLTEVVAAVRAAGAEVSARFTPHARPAGLPEVIAALHRNDAASLRFLRQALCAARPQAGWVEDELERGPLPAGEWWVTDAVEGNINHVHGLTDWAVTATLVRDDRPVVAAVYQPLTADTYTAVRGGGAHLNGARLRVSAKTRLDGAYVGTGQAMPGEDQETLDRIGASYAALLRHALVARVSVPATLQLIHVAAGRTDAFWQYSDVRSGLLAGALLVAEAGGTVTDTRGRPWSLASDDFLATTPALLPAMVAALPAPH
ncbi:inositol monophosphatase family protein [Streptomyces sp. NPDC057702]|uniref:inositol monophosphatase family protein n=1 Tax=unclassified Streptomyces TaxID=2593676 RepID=UPI00368B1770